MRHEGNYSGKVERQLNFLKIIEGRWKNEESMKELHLPTFLKLLTLVVELSKLKMQNINTSYLWLNLSNKYLVL